MGDYDTVARRIVEFTEAGIETFLLQVQPFKREMGLFANEIAPSLRALQGPGAKAFDDRAARA